MAYGRGHTRGTKVEKKGATPQFDAIQEAWLRKLEAAWTPPTPLATATPGYAVYAAAWEAKQQAGTK
jgi:hypothetical protein